MKKITAIRELDTHLEIFTNDRNNIKKIDSILSALRPGHEFEPRFQSGISDGRTRFYETKKVEGGLLFIVSRGFKQRLLDNIIFNITELKSDEDPLDKELLKKNISTLPFKPRDYQLKAVLGFIKKPFYFPSMCTGSGKSLVAYLTFRYLYEKNLKGILLVPTISLTEQMYGDFKDYGAPEEFLNNIRLIGGDNNEKTLDKPIIIGTYQSLVKIRNEMSRYDYILVDEAHLASAESMQLILQNPFKKKLGMTGSIPIIEVDKLAIIQVFGEPEHIITARELMDRGLLTDSTITPLFLRYERGQDGLRSGLKYQDEVKFIKQSKSRMNFIKSFLQKLPGLSVCLYAHNEHGENTFKSITGVDVKPNDIETMKKYNVFLINGKTKGKIREEIRKYTEHLDKGIIIANYKVFSTGINLPNLTNLILLSSTKSYVTVLQSLGRVFRKKEGKIKARIFDIIDVFPYKKESYSLKHFWQRLAAYRQENHIIIEKEIDMKKYKD